MKKKYFIILVLSLSLVPFSAFSDHHKQWKTVLHVKNKTNEKCQLIQVDTGHDEFDQALLEAPIESGGKVKVFFKQRKGSKPVTINNKIVYQCGKQFITLQFNRKGGYVFPKTHKAFYYIFSSVDVLSHDLGINAKHKTGDVTTLNPNHVFFKIFDEK